MLEVFLGYSNAEIEKCTNDGNIVGSENVGGIIGRDYTASNANYCINNGKIQGTKSAGGIVGSTYGTIYRCGNTGKVEGRGGIADTSNGANIIECYNTGEIVHTSGYKAGIVSMINATTKIMNCYNFTSEAIRLGGQNAGKIINSYNINSRISVTNSGKINNCYCVNATDANATQKTELEMKAQGIITLLNTLTETTTTKDETTGEDVTTTTTTTQNVWLQDTRNINQGYPILAWQVE